MTPREYQLVLKHWGENNKYKNRDICEAIRVSSWHSSRTKLSYSEYCANHFKLFTDSLSSQEITEINPDEDMNEVKDKLKNIMNIKEAQ